jgi:hypothetical protein
MSSTEERSGVEKLPKRPRLESLVESEECKVDGAAKNNDEEEPSAEDKPSSERPTIPDELVLRFASYANQRKLYLTLLTLTKSIQEKSQLSITEHPKFTGRN